ncbi:hypothetical protein MCOR28_005968, partial [Pyricularia oryzae]
QLVMDGRSAGGCERQAKKTYYHGVRKAPSKGQVCQSQGSLPKGLEMFPLPTGVIAALRQAPVPSSLVKIGTNSARMTRWI